MKFLNALGAAAVALTSMQAISTAAKAETYVVSESRTNVLACYNKVYVPAKVLVNTRGVLVRGESQGWSVTGDQWLRVRSPAVYIQTRKTIESDHYTLVRC